MLVLSRKPNESVTIGDDIRVTILSIDPDRVKLGIEAPRNMRVYRYETMKKVVLENRSAADAKVNMANLVHLKDKLSRKETSEIANEIKEITKEVPSDGDGGDE